VGPRAVGDELDARRVGGDHEHAGGGHDEQQVGHTAGAGEPLLAVDDPLVAVLHGVGDEQVGIGAALGLGHRVGGEDVLVHERDQPPLLLLLGAVGGEQLHVPGVRGGGAEEAGGGRVAAEDLVDQRQLELAEAGPAQLLVEEQGPQSAVLDLLLEPPGQGLDLGVAGAQGVGEDRVERLDLLAAELLDPVELLLELGFGGEIPGHRASPSGVGR
jgi:hypothetical protein